MENIQITTDEDKAFFEQMDYFSTYGKGFGAKTVWSIYDEGIQFGNDHPFGDDVVIRHKCDVFGPYDVTVPVEGKRWGDVWAAADKADVMSCDLHHIYIEGFEIKGNELTLVTGS